MGSSTLLLSIFAVFLMIQWTNAVNARCPTPDKVYSVKPTCRDDYDCKGGQVCCTNQARTLSCAEPAPYHQRQSYDNYKNKNAKRYKRASILGGPGVFCGGVKCMPFQKCIRDPYTAKLVCRRQ